LAGRRCQHHCPDVPAQSVRVRKVRDDNISSSALAFGEGNLNTNITLQVSHRHVAQAGLVLLAAMFAASVCQAIVDTDALKRREAENRVR